MFRLHPCSDPRRAARLLSFVLALALAACGGDDPTGPLTNGSLSMTVDGTAWSATSVSAQRSGGLVSVAAVEQATVIGFGLAFPDGGTGTFDIGATTETAFTYSEGADGWTAHAFTGSGSITVTTLTSERVAGTFQGELTPGGGAATGNVIIANGTLTSGSSRSAETSGRFRCGSPSPTRRRRADWACCLYVRGTIRPSAAMA